MNDLLIVPVPAEDDEVAQYFIAPINKNAVKAWRGEIDSIRSQPILVDMQAALFTSDAAVVTGLSWMDDLMAAEDGWIIYEPSIAEREDVNTHGFHANCRREVKPATGAFRFVAVDGIAQWASITVVQAALEDKWFNG